MKNKLIKISSIVILIIFCLSVTLVLIYKSERENTNLWDGDKLIGHAFGEIDGIAYTNSLEAFSKTYDKGLRTMEVDLGLTSDNKVVLVHDWNNSFNNVVPAEDLFLNTKVKGKYTSLSFEDLVLLMKKYPDLYIVTDSKYTDEEIIKIEFNEMLNVIKKLNMPEVLDRFIIQIYNEEMYNYITNLYPFKNIIFTLYTRWDGNLKDFENICRWSQKHNVNHITMWNHLYNKDIYKIIKKYNLKVYVHTENNIKNANNFLKNGVTGIYTDIITPRDIKDNM